VLKWLRWQLEDFYTAGFDAFLKQWGKYVILGGELVLRIGYHMF
jgi:hypothetical protein